ncbi:hypothetical protein PFISCL1PPCAC_13016, partial [Pristionchus fissidentatus]
QYLSMRASTVALLLLLLAFAIATAQLLPGSTTGAVANGRGGLGRFLRNMENRDSYYPEYASNGFYPYGQVAFFG